MKQVEDDMFEYDEDEAVAFIRNYLPQELKTEVQRR